MTRRRPPPSTGGTANNNRGQFQTQVATPLSLAVRLNDQGSVNVTPSGVDFANPDGSQWQASLLSAGIRFRF